MNYQPLHCPELFSTQQTCLHLSNHTQRVTWQACMSVILWFQPKKCHFYHFELHYHVAKHKWNAPLASWTVLSLESAMNAQEIWLRCTTLICVDHSIFMCFHVKHQRTQYLGLTQKLALTHHTLFGSERVTRDTVSWCRMCWREVERHLQMEDSLPSGSGSTTKSRLAKWTCDHKI